MDDFSSVETLVYDVQILAYTKVACLMLLIYDTLITLDQERRYIWQREWHLVKILYIFARYTTFVDTTITVYAYVNRNLPDCGRLNIFEKIFSGAGIGLSEIILMIRTYALFNSSKRVLAFLVVMGTVSSGFNVWAVFKWAESYHGSSDLPSGLGASMECYAGGANNLGLKYYLSLLGGETIIVLMTAWKAWYQYRTGINGSRLVTSFYRDGILFYFCILPFTIFNTVAILYLPDGLQADTPLRVVHTLSTCRLVLHLRRVADPGSDSSADRTLDSLRFRNPDLLEIKPEEGMNQRDNESMSGSEHVVNGWQQAFGGEWHITKFEQVLL